MCSHVFGVSVVLSGLFLVTSFRPCGAGCCAASSVSAPSAAGRRGRAVPRPRMNSRRFRYTFLSVISELGISAGAFDQHKKSLQSWSGLPLHYRYIRGRGMSSDAAQVGLAATEDFRQRKRCTDSCHPKMTIFGVLIPDRPRIADPGQCCRGLPAHATARCRKGSASGNAR